MVGEGGGEFLLKFWVAGGGVGVLSLLVVPVFPADLGFGIVAHCQPGLGLVAEGEVVRGGGSAHAGGHPAGADGVAQHVRPQAGDVEDKCGEQEFAVGVGAGFAFPRPVDAAETGLPTQVHAAAQVHQAAGPLNQRG